MISLHNNSYINPQFSHTITTNRRKKIRIHYHKEYEVYYLINGTTKYFIDDKIFFLEPGSFVIIPPHSYHMTDSEMCLHNERIVISFSEDLVTPEIAPVLKELCNKNVIVLPQSKLLKAENILELMEKEDEIIKISLIYMGQVSEVQEWTIVNFKDKEMTLKYDGSAEVFKKKK